MIAVDSFKLRIPLEEVTILQPEFFNKDNYKVVNVANGEMLTEKQWKGTVPSIQVYKYVTIRIAIEWQINRNQKVEQYLTLMLNSKLLLERYFEGIHAGTLRLLYDNLMSAPEVKQLIHIPYSSFKAGAITDCDYKQDVKRSMVHFKAAIHKLQGIVGRDNPVVKAYTRQDNMGIQFSRRETTEIVKKPFLKMYAKKIQMLKDHADFLREVLNGGVEDDRIRIEHTIKNLKHWRMYGIDTPTLDIVTNLPQDTLKEMQQTAIQAYIGTTQQAPKKRSTSLKPEDILILDYMEESIHRGISYSEWRNERKMSMKANEVSRNTIARKMEKYDGLYREHIKGSPEDEKATGAQQFLFDVFGSVFEPVEG